MYGISVDNLLINGVLLNNKNKLTSEAWISLIILNDQLIPAEWDTESSENWIRITAVKIL